MAETDLNEIIKNQPGQGNNDEMTLQAILETLLRTEKRQDEAWKDIHHELREIKSALWDIRKTTR